MTSLKIWLKVRAGIIFRIPDRRGQAEQLDLFRTT